MHILLAPDKFKGSLTAAQVCQAMETGIRRRYPDATFTHLPLADGGEGTLDVIETLRPTQRIAVTVNDPLFRPIEAYYLRDGNTAFVEMAQASGLPLLTPDERNTAETTTYGTGELLRHAIENGATDIYLFVGGSATTDGGIGMAAALGYAFTDAHGQPVRPIGRNLSAITSILRPNQESNLKRFVIKDNKNPPPTGGGLTVICDVENPLYGPTGAAYVYAPQKGATLEEVVQLDSGLRNLAEVIRADLGVDVAETVGGGAAGGIAAGAVAFLNAEIRSGVQTLMELTAFENAVAAAHYVITGEGKLDQQTLHGKLIAGITRAVRQFPDKVVYAVCGTLELSEDQWRSLGMENVVAVKTDDMSLEEAMTDTFNKVADAAAKLEFYVDV